MIKPSFISGPTSNTQTKSLLSALIKNYNHSDCCPCNGILSGNINDKRLLALCQEWMANVNELKVPKATIIDEVSLISNLKLKKKNCLFFFIVAFNMWTRESK